MEKTTNVFLITKFLLLLTALQCLQAYAQQLPRITQFEENDVNIMLDLQSNVPKSVTVKPTNVNYTADVQIIAENILSNIPVNIRGRSGTRFKLIPEQVVVKIRGGVDEVSRIDPSSDLGLYVDYLNDGENVLKVKNDQINSNFEILSIQPNQIEIIRE